MIIDVYNHILPKKYQDALEKKVPKQGTPTFHQIIGTRRSPTLLDLDARFRIMDAFEGYMQVITVASPPSYSLAPAPVAIELAKNR